MDSATRERMQLAGFSAADLAWLENFGGDPARVPRPGASEVDDYRRREAALNAAIAPLSFSERGASPEGRLAAAIGAQVANAQDTDEDE